MRTEPNLEAKACTVFGFGELDGHALRFSKTTLMIPTSSSSNMKVGAANELTTAQNHLLTMSGKGQPTPLVMNQQKVRGFF